LPRVLAVHSTNDWRVPIAQNSAWLQKNLNAEVFTIGDAGHVITRHGWQDWSDELYEKADKFLADDDK
jgi:predicted alpha/beta hydrolase family esterase